MKIRNTNQETIKSIIAPEDKPGVESGKVRENTSLGVASVKSTFEMAPSENAIARQALTPDQFSLNEKGQVVVQKQQLVELLKSQTEKSGKPAEAVADKAQSETHIWYNADTKRISGKSSEIEAFVIDGPEKFARNNPEARSIVEPEDRPVGRPFAGNSINQIIDPEDLPTVDQIIEPNDRLLTKGKVREDGSVRFNDQIVQPQDLPPKVK
jgi:hypothetical protein